VHRDVKTENVVYDEERTAEPIKAEDGSVIGVRIKERIRVKLIDFGLVKVMNVSQFPVSPSPGVADASGWNSFSISEVLDQDPSHVIAVSPCGTELYCALEVIDGILEGGAGRSKWISTVSTLPLFDVYGAGTVLYCMCNGRPPFRLPPFARVLSNQERLRKISDLIASGPVFTAGCPEDVRPLILRLMNNDIRVRPTGADALRDPLLSRVSDVYCYEVLATNVTTEIPMLLPEVASTSAHGQHAPSSPAPVAPPPTPALSTVAEDVVEGEGDDAVAINDIMEAQRGREDGGDGAQKQFR